MDNEKDNVFSLSTHKKKLTAMALAAKDDAPFIERAKQQVIECLDVIKEESIRDDVVSIAFVVTYADGSTGSSYQAPYWPSAIIGELECLKARIMHELDL